MDKTTNTIDHLRAKIFAGITQHELITIMKGDQMSISEAIKAVRELYSINLGAAKQVVASHPCYRDAAIASRPLHEDLLRAFEEGAPDNTTDPKQ